MFKKKRKTRVTKKDIEKARVERSITSAQRKRKVIPGPWTERETKLKVKAYFKYNNKGVMADILGPSYGSYTKDELWGEKGWYSLVFNLVAEDMKSIIAEHGMDNFLAACEKSLNEQLDTKKKPKYGRIIITIMCVDHSNRESERRFISCRGKTNKKGIEGFRAIRKGELVTL